MNHEPPSTFQELFRNNYPTVVLRLMRLVHNQDVAEDLAQEVFLRLYRTPPDDLHKVMPWLSRVLTHIAYDYLREQLRQRSLHSRICATETLQYTEPGSDDVLLQQLDREQVTRVLGRLSNRDQQALLLRHSGYSYREIADILSVHVETVGTLVLRATQRFRREYDKEEGTENDRSRNDPARGSSLGAVSTTGQG